MNKALTLMMALAFMLVPAAFAAVEEPIETEATYAGGFCDGGTKVLDRACQDQGYDYGIARWRLTLRGWDKVSEIDGYDTTVSGTFRRVDWTSTPGVAGVISLENLVLIDHAGGTEGSFDQSVLTHRGREYPRVISQVGFCGSYEEVPEFGTVALVAVGLLGVGLVAAKRQ